MNNTESLVSSSSAEIKQFILTKIERLTLVFPASLVAKILLVDRSQILSLPFYDPIIVGCTYQTGEIVPLVATDRLLGMQQRIMGEVLTVVCLGKSAGDLAGVGLINDRALGSQTQDRLPPRLVEISREDVPDNQKETTRLFSLSLLERELFQPQRWQSKK
jgi:chemotaxis signal transduction protein